MTKHNNTTIIYCTITIASIITIFCIFITSTFIHEVRAQAPPIVQSSNYIIYKNGSYNYVSHSINGAIFSDKDPAKVFQHTLNDFQPDTSLDLKKGWAYPGSIYVVKGNYNFFPNFTGLNLNQYTRLTFDPFAHLIVPNGYKGYVFGLEANNTKLGSSNNIIDGGIIGEYSNKSKSLEPNRLWTAFQLLSSASNNKTDCNEANGVLFNKITNTEIHNANIGIDLKVTGNKSFINANSFESLKMWNNFIFIDFNMTTPYIRGSECQGIFRNHFENIDAESADTTKFKTGYGVRNIMNKENTFIDVRIWDFPNIPVGNNSDGIPEHKITTDAKIANIVSGSSNNIIIGGIMTSNITKNPNRSFEDKGTGTLIFDRNMGISTGFNGTHFIPQFTISPTETNNETLGFFGQTPKQQQPGSKATAGNSYGQTEKDMLQKVYNATMAYGLIS